MICQANQKTVLVLWLGELMKFNLNLQFQLARFNQLLIELQLNDIHQLYPKQSQDYRMGSKGSQPRGEQRAVRSKENCYQLRDQYRIKDEKVGAKGQNKQLQALQERANNHSNYLQQRQNKKVISHHQPVQRPLNDCNSVRENSIFQTLGRKVDGRVSQSSVKNQIRERYVLTNNNLPSQNIKSESKPRNTTNMAMNSPTHMTSRQNKIVENKYNQDQGSILTARKRSENNNKPEIGQLRQANQHNRSQSSFSRTFTNTKKDDTRANIIEQRGQSIVLRQPPFSVLIEKGNSSREGSALEKLRRISELNQNINDRIRNIITVFQDYKC